MVSICCICSTVFVTYTNHHTDTCTFVCELVPVAEAPRRAQWINASSFQWKLSGPRNRAGLPLPQERRAHAARCVHKHHKLGNRETRDAGMGYKARIHYSAQASANVWEVNESAVSGQFWETTPSWHHTQNLTCHKDLECKPWPFRAQQMACPEHKKCCYSHSNANIHFF